MRLFREVARLGVRVPRALSLVPRHQSVEAAWVFVSPIAAATLLALAHLAKLTSGADGAIRLPK